MRMAGWWTVKTNSQKFPIKAEEIKIWELSFCLNFGIFCFQHIVDLEKCWKLIKLNPWTTTSVCERPEIILHSLFVFYVIQLNDVRYDLDCTAEISNSNWRKLILIKGRFQNMTLPAVYIIHNLSTLRRPTCIRNFLMKNVFLKRNDKRLVVLRKTATESLN